MSKIDIVIEFLGFFEKKNHKVIDSSSCVPTNEDKSLLFVNAGMVQFKDYFIGLEKAPYSCATSCQKCVRAGGKHNDLDNVGYTNRHHTFFEMLGNFSFGEYFKKEAIEFAWEFLTEVLKINKSRLAVTYYAEDLETKEIWKRVSGLSNDRIVAIATEDNFWSMGDTGPCGPCSEIFYDLGEDVKPIGGCLDGGIGENDRWLEIWNLVFMQYEKKAGGRLIELPKKCVDTGASVERLNAVLEGKIDTYETESFSWLIGKIADGKYQKEFEVNYRVVTDHLRCIAFLITDGISPDKDGRGYVLRRIIRRAIRYANEIEVKLSEKIRFVVQQMGSRYPDLIKKENEIIGILKKEEELFSETLKSGLDILQKELENNHGKVFSGEIAFKLYDTYGFPLDLTEDILRRKDIKVNIEEFNECMKEQKERAKASWIGKNNEVEVNFDGQNIPKTERLYYDGLKICNSKVLFIDGNWIALDKTVFYPQGGGQEKDFGVINSSKVIDIKQINGVIFHLIEEKGSQCNIGDLVRCVAFRNSDKTHTAAHLLQAALRKVLGNVEQKGSNVDSLGLRFDFNFDRKLSNEELSEVERLVNTWVYECLDVRTVEMTIDEAKKSGALAFFGDKYGEVVRVVNIGDVSSELCGGCHAQNTGEIERFAIANEMSVGSGVRRIEAVIGARVLDFNKIKKLESDVLETKSEVSKLKKNIASKDEQIAFAEIKKDGEFFKLETKELDNNSVVSAGRRFLQNHDGILVSYNNMNDRTIVTVLRSKNESKSCKDILDEILSKEGGKGGGNDKFANGVVVN